MASDYTNCPHVFGPSKTLYYPDTFVSYGCVSVCKKCGARLFDDWTINRVGGVEKVLPPEEKPGRASDPF